MHFLSIPFFPLYIAFCPFYLLFLFVQYLFLSVHRIQPIFLSFFIPIYLSNYICSYQPQSVHIYLSYSDYFLSFFLSFFSRFFHNLLVYLSICRLHSTNFLSFPIYLSIYLVHFPLLSPSLYFSLPSISLFITLSINQLNVSLI